MQCPNCSSVNRDDAKFCDECGFPLGGALARAAANFPISNLSANKEPLKASDDSEMAKENDAIEQDDQSIEDDENNAQEGESNSSELDSSPENLVDEGDEDAESRDESDNEPEDETDEFENEPEDESEGDDNSAESDAETHASDIERTFAPSDGDDVGEEKQETTRSEEGASDLTGVIRDFSSEELTRQFSEEDFAGFSTPSDDGYSFSGAYADEARDPMGGQVAGYTMKMPRIDGESKPSEQKHDFIASATVPKKSHGKTIAIVVLVVAIIAAIVVGLLYFAGVWGGKAIPDVTNMTETDARAVLEEAGFTVRTSQVKSDDTEGLVLIMDPASGTRAPDNSEVVIHVAAARLIPDIVGKTAEEAEGLLRDAGYDTITFERVKSEGDEGIVLSVEPEPGSRAKSTTEVVVRVSEAFRVPDVSGMYWDQALATVREAGFEPQIVYVNTEYYQEGTIMGTSPEAGTVAPEGSYVSINVAQSRATVLTSLTQSLLVPGSTVNINGYNYTIDALTAVSYVGNNTVAFTITGRPYVSLFGEVIHASPQTVNGQVVWSPSNEVVSIT